MTLTTSSIPISCVDLFCGAGGLTHGLRSQGFEVSAGIDIDPACRFPYEHNNGGAKFIEQDVESFTAEQLSSLFTKGKYRLLAGCAPCQPFSTYAQGRDTSRDSKWGLLRSFANLVKKVNPDLVTMENVPQLPQHEVFSEFVSVFSDYHIWYGVVECERYGLPQKRKRLVFLASKFGPISLIPPTHDKESFKTVAEAIGDLPRLKAGQVDSNDPLHAAANLSDINFRRIKQSKPGGTWRDWDHDLVAACHKEKSGSTYGSVYGRMRWDAPSPTMTTLCYGYGNGRFGHPEQDRGISLREAALLQTFPITYKFAPDNERIRFKTVGRLIGNAVPVELGEVIGKSIKSHLLDWGVEDGPEIADH